MSLNVNLLSGELLSHHHTKPSSLHTPIVLGYSWLKIHNPHFDWSLSLPSAKPCSDRGHSSTCWICRWFQQFIMIWKSCSVNNTLSLCLLIVPMIVPWILSLELHSLLVIYSTCLDQTGRLCSGEVHSWLPGCWHHSLESVSFLSPNTMVLSDLALISSAF